MHPNGFKWISLVFFIWGTLSAINLLTENYSWSPKMFADITIVIFGFGYGYHLRTKKKSGFK